MWLQSFSKIPLGSARVVRNICSRKHWAGYFTMHGRVAVCAAAALSVVMHANSVSAQSMLRGTVRDSATGSPIGQAEIFLRSLLLRARTDDAGRFSVGGIPAGGHLVVARRLGFDSTSVVLNFSGGDTLFADFALTRSAQPLPEVEVRRPLAARNAKLREFDRRREKGAGRFYSAADLEKDLSRRTGDIISKIPGAYIVRNGMAACLGSSRGTIELSNTGSAQTCGGRPVRKNLCPIAVYLDGALVTSRINPEMFNLNMIQPSEIAALEFYSGPAQLPPELNATGNGCGALVIWIK